MWNILDKRKSLWDGIGFLSIWCDKLDEGKPQYYNIITVSHNINMIYRVRLILT